jgi:hypothetical protein
VRVYRVRIVLESRVLGFFAVPFTVNSSIVVCDSGLLEVVLRAVFLTLVLFLVASKSHAPTENMCGMVSILGGFSDIVCVRFSD